VLKRWLPSLLVLGFASVALVGCNAHSTQATYATNSAAPQGTKTMKQLAYSTQGCRIAVSRAYRSLNYGKQHSVPSEKFVNWDKIDFLLAASLAAQQNRNYTYCVTNAQQVDDLIDRNQHYLAWQKALGAK
jgi:hypothetical protein